jgi:1-deoxy-D-xylulose-5-phosphate reductoisomerase
LPTLAAAKAGKRILLANKEALVMSGALFMETLAHAGASLLPVDSEHNAIFQCMPNGYQIGQSPSGVDKIILTASGGPFLGLTPTEFSEITPEQAVSHPTWNMGAKISVDSATLMNKGFEVIEAYWLFQLTLNQIQVVIHPQSIIHSFVCFQDGSLLAQLGAPDMRIPIAYTLSWPERLQTPVKKLDLVELGQLTFQSVDRVKFPCLDLAYAAVKTGGTASTLLNAANEIAVAAFLNRQIPFTAIPEIISEVMQKVVINSAESIEVILEADKIARSVASSLIQSS